MLKLTALLVVSSIALVPSLARADKDFTDGTGGTHDCAQDSSVNIVHDGGSYTLTGECSQVNISGSNVRITIADVESLSINGTGNVVQATVVGAIQINGTKNSVRWKTPKTGRRPKVATNGSRNSVSKSK